jgi:hypothetical protein
MLGMSALPRKQTWIDAMGISQMLAQQNTKSAEGLPVHYLEGVP